MSSSLLISTQEFVYKCKPSFLCRITGIPITFVIFFFYFHNIHDPRTCKIITSVSKINLFNHKLYLLWSFNICIQTPVIALNFFSPLCLPHIILFHSYLETSSDLSLQPLQCLMTNIPATNLCSFLNTFGLVLMLW